jgi:hypothetical protein
MLFKLIAAIVTNLDAHKVTRFKDADFLRYSNRVVFIVVQNCWFQLKRTYLIALTTYNSRFGPGR